VVRKTVGAVEASTSLTEVWNALRPLAGALDAARLEFRFYVPRTTTHEREGLHYELERVDGSAHPVELTVELGQVDGESLGVIQATWRDGRSEVDRDDELVLEHVAQAVTVTILRISIPPVVEGAKVVPLRK